MTLLRTKGLNKNFGALNVASEIDFQLASSARHALIGPNGAGKTTFINIITGAVRPSSGEIFLQGQNITALQQWERSRLGVARTFQINQLFQGLSVIENVSMAVAERTGACRSLFRPLGWRSDVIDEAFVLLKQFKLQDTALRPVREIAYGQQRLIEIAVALGQGPKVLLLDEPAAGVPSSDMLLITDAIESLTDRIAVLIVEHDLDVVFRFANRITVLVSGSILAEGTPDEIAADERVRTAYLGETIRG